MMDDMLRRTMSGIGKNIAIYCCSSYKSLNIDDINLITFHAFDLVLSQSELVNCSAINKWQHYVAIDNLAKRNLKEDQSALDVIDGFCQLFWQACNYQDLDGPYGGRTKQFQKVLDVRSLASRIKIVFLFCYEMFEFIFLDQENPRV